MFLGLWGYEFQGLASAAVFWASFGGVVGVVRFAVGVLDVEWRGVGDRGGFGLGPGRRLVVGQEAGVVLDVPAGNVGVTVDLRGMGNDGDLTDAACRRSARHE